MKNRLILKTTQIAVMALAAQLILTANPARAQLDETCLVSINGQTVSVGFGSTTFRVRLCHLHEKWEGMLWPPRKEHKCF